MQWYSIYCFEVTLIEFIQFLTVFRLDLDNSSYSFHPIRLKHGGQLDYEVMQGILFQGYSTPNFDRVIAL